MVFAIILALIAFIVIMVMRLQKGKKQLQDEGFDQIINAGTFIGGHPDIDNSIKNAKISANSDEIAIGNAYFKTLGRIKKDNIKDVVFEDATTFGTRVGLGRLALVGIFAFALKKKSKQTRAYTVIEWNDGKFDHSTSFLFEGAMSINEANKLRNTLIKWLR